jgi:hypothetical protein
MLSSFGSAAASGLNSNFAPRSCSRENSSRDGNFAASSSTACTRTWTSFESNAANGSLLVPLDPAGVTLAETLRFCGAFVGRPLRMGVISGRDDCDGRSTDLTFDMPTMGGEATSMSLDGNCSYLRVSDCDRLAYISCIGQSVLRIEQTSFTVW